jgi:hypothetical protein
MFHGMSNLGQPAATAAPTVTGSGEREEAPLPPPLLRIWASPLLLLRPPPNPRRGREGMPSLGRGRDAPGEPWGLGRERRRGSPGRGRNEGVG